MTALQSVSAIFCTMGAIQGNAGESGVLVLPKLQRCNPARMPDCGAVFRGAGLDTSARSFPKGTPPCVPSGWGSMRPAGGHIFFFEEDFMKKFWVFGITLLSVLLVLGGCFNGATDPDSGARDGTREGALL
jgi:hypothetical protein